MSLKLNNEEKAEVSKSGEPATVTDECALSNDSKGAELPLNAVKCESEEGQTFSRNSLVGEKTAKGVVAGAEANAMAPKKEEGPGTVDNKRRA